MIIFFLLFANAKSEVAAKVRAVQNNVNQSFKKSFEGFMTNYAELLKEEQNARRIFQEYAIARSGYLPKVDLEASHGYSQIRNTKNPDPQNPDPQNPEKNWGDESTLQVRVRQNIMDGGQTTGLFKRRTNEAYSAAYAYYSKRNRFIVEKFFDNILKIIFQKEKLKFTQASKKSRFGLLEELKSSIELKSRKMYEQARDNYAAISIKENEEAQELRNLKLEFFERTGYSFPENIHISLPQSLPSTFEQARTLMFTKNPTIIQAKYAVKSGEAELTRARSEFLPTVNVDGSFGYNNQESRKTINNNETTFEPESQRLTKRIGINLTYPLFSGGKSVAEVRKASRELSQAKKELMQVVQDQEISLKRAWENYQFAKQSQKDFQIRVESMRVAWKSTKAEYNEGIVDLRILTDEEDRYLSAQEKQAENNKNLILAAWQLKMTLGDFSPCVFTKMDFFDPLKEYDCVRRRF